MTTPPTRFLLLLVCSLTLLQFIITSGFAQEPLAPPPRTFGVVGAYWRPQAAAELGVTWDRITFDWSRFQPNGPGDFVRDAVRPAWIEQSLASGREVVGMIVNTPAWASSAGTPASVPSSLYRAADDPENLWALFLRQLVQEYAPRGVHHWIIWDNINVPADSPDYRFAGDVETYVQMVRIAHDVIRAEDEMARLYLGGLVGVTTDSTSTPYLQQFLDELNGDTEAAANNFYFDGVTLNFLLYPQRSTDLPVPMTETIIPTLQQTRDILDSAALSDKEIWVTELNASPTRNTQPNVAPPPAHDGISLSQQAGFIMQGSALALSGGADRIAVYELFDAEYEANEPQFGLIQSNNNRRPAFTAYQQVVNLFGETSIAEYDETTNGRLVTLFQEEQTVFVMWSAGTTPVSFWIEARFGDDTQVLDTFGERMPNPRQGVGPEETTVHVIDTFPATPTLDGTVLVSGAPRILILNTTEPRRVWASLGDAIGVQLR